MPHDFFKMGTWEDGKNRSSGLTNVPGKVWPTWKMSDCYGQGSINLICFRSGMFLSLQNRRFKHRIKTFAQTNGGGISFHFYLTGYEILKGDGIKESIHLRQDANGFIVAGDGWQYQVESPADQNVSIVSIGLPPTTFREIVYADEAHLPSSLFSVCEGNIPEFESLSRPSTPQIRWILQQMLNSSLSLSQRPLYFEAKSLELIDLILDSFNRTNRGNNTVTRFQPDDIDRIYYAREVMQKNLSNPPCLFDLAKISGMNHCKLNRGFKALFGNTVFGCLREMRLEKARQLLRTGEMNVTEVSNSIGYSCLSHFAKAFKAQYHISPRSCLK
ncbi:AraC family transcriptional regulator [uncultured Desulfobacter sp.]|uniref:helix-turn-helix transcriptional regulator n=1 Tax=uncultured Desulfobacter sp. TaxID=240139 RepID=UPI0029F5925A|nr:AraC family transcriptional regulator [uncultured Desulfobacter sp.]